VSRRFLDEFKNIVDCRFSLGDCAGQAGRSGFLKSTIDNRQSAIAQVCGIVRDAKQLSSFLKGEPDWQQKI
jgi:hypothetical protein